MYEFISIANANTPRNANRDAFRLRLFPFTLKDKAKYWFTSLPSNSITSWDQLKAKFLQEFYPDSKTTELVKLFFEAVSKTHQAMINASSSGTFMWQEPEDAWRFLEQLSLGSKVSGTMKDNTVYVENMEAESMWKTEIQKELSAEIFGMLVKLQEVEKSHSEAILKLGELIIKMEEDRTQERAQASKKRWRKKKRKKEEKKDKEEQAKKKKQTSTWEKEESSGTVPFPTALEKPEKIPYGKKGPQAEDMWELFSQINVNIPLVKLIKEVPTYVLYKAHVARNKSPKDPEDRILESIDLESTEDCKP
ncbi:hypothetical protein L2E82_35585 [Cichorium intybus]|uniref:Uncharacterized protein n=1 Tax=Cichorium intybus TaxID=13427 RepID=A0ACB9BP61_CICIN|nr:hypothetical protein L2E82_35585 [Cichorium intybus]